MGRASNRKAVARSGGTGSTQVAVQTAPIVAGTVGVADVVPIVPTSEYVTGGRLGWFGMGNGYSVMPPGMDDLSRDFGLDVYEQMMLDPQIAASANLVKLAILSQGVKLVNRFSMAAPQYKQAQNILEFCQRNLFMPGRLQQPFKQTLYELLDAVIFGHKAAELTYEHLGGGIDHGKLGIRSIKTKPLRSTQFVVDRFLNVLGLWAWRVAPSVIDSQTKSTGSSTESAPSVGGASGTGTGLDILGQNTGMQVLPRSKFVVYTWKSHDSDPRGTSQIRPAYNAWNMKRQAWPEYLTFLAVYAIPMLVGKVGPNTIDVAVKDAAGNVTYVSAAQALLNTLVQARNRTALVVGSEDEVDPLQVNGEGQAFLSAVDLFDRQITTGILYTTRATMEAANGSKADSQTAQDVVDMLIADGKEATQNVIEADVIVPLVMYNFGPEAVSLMPQVQLPAAPPQDRAALMTALAMLWKDRYFHSSQVEKLDAQYGFPERDMDAWQKEQQDDKAAAQEQAMAKAQQPTATPTEKPQQQPPNSQSPPSKDGAKPPPDKVK